jgi:hypothetical protein
MIEKANNHINKKKRILLLYQGYPQITKTYMENELQDLLLLDYEVMVINIYRPANVPANSYINYKDYAKADYFQISQEAKKFKPDHIHAHYFHVAPLLVKLAEDLNIPCSLRGHSADILDPEKMGTERFPIEASIKAMFSDNFKGMLTLPFTIETLKKWGAPLHKLISVPPVFNYNLFYNREQNDVGVMNVGAALPKKNMGDYLKLSTLMPQTKFDLYGVGFNVTELHEENKKLNFSVNFHQMINYKEMPNIYKNHSWLVYTACSISNSVGWPMAILEAQASGVGVCMQNIRPDLIDFLGESGILFDSIEELTAIISQPPSVEMREKGFINAEKYDYQKHKLSFIKMLENV